MQQTLLAELQGILGSIAQFINFFKEFNPRDLDEQRKSVLFQYTITNLEGVTLKVDLLKNSVAKILSTKQVLT